MAQQEAAAGVGLDLEVAVGGVMPSVEDRDHREAARAEVEDVGLGLAAPAGTSVHANLHDAKFPFDPPLALHLQGAGHASCAVRRMSALPRHRPCQYTRDLVGGDRVLAGPQS